VASKQGPGSSALARTQEFACQQDQTSQRLPTSGAGRRDPRNQGAACVQAGLVTLERLGLLQAAQQQLYYSTLANPTTGPIFTTLPEGSYLWLGQLVKLHTTNPELFAWCR
jgi:hypothetical protein